MKRFFLILFLSALLICMMAGCGSGNDGAACADILNSVKESQTDGFDTLYTYDDRKYQDSFNFMYGITWDMIDDGGILYTSGGGLADEISLVHLKKDEDVSIAKDKMMARIEDRKNQFSGYKPEEVYKLDNAIVMVQGRYVALIIGEDPQMLESGIREAISQ